jgi:hypothetical protein
MVVRIQSPLKTVQEWEGINTGVEIGMVASLTGAIEGKWLWLWGYKNI